MTESFDASAIDQGATIGRYVVLSQLGAGAMGVVFAAYDPELDRKVALKLLSLGEGDRSAAQTRLQREAQALAKLNHRNVVAVHDVGMHEGNVFVAMEYVEGRTLGEWMSDGPHNWREVLRVFVQAGRGLAAAHDCGLVHRDFKPDNVMLDKAGGARVMDFGLARLSDDETAEQVPIEDAREVGELDPLSTPLTQTGTIMGTPAYMAPEQFLGGSVDARSDQFGFCIALHEALYKVRPFAGDSFQKLFLTATRSEFQDVPRGASVPAWVRGIVRRGLESKPEKRWPSMEVLSAKLEQGQARFRLLMILLLVTALGIVAAGVAGYGEWKLIQRTQACHDAGDTIDEVWNAETQEALREGLIATRVKFASTVAEKVMPWIYKQAEAWREATTSACLEATVHKTWNAKQFDKANWCLEERRLQLTTLATQMADADERTVSNAVYAAAKLSSVAQCVEEASLSVMPTPPAIEERPEIVTVREMIAKTDYMLSSGAYKDGLKMAHAAREKAEKLSWPPLTAVARLTFGKALDLNGAYAKSEVAFISAYMLSGRQGNWDTAAAAAVQLVQVVGHKQARMNEGKIWAEHSALAIAHIGNPIGLEEAARCSSLAGLYWSSGQHEQALTLFQRAFEIRKDVLGPEHPAVASILGKLGVVRQEMGESKHAKVLLVQGLQILKKALGSEHPNVAANLANLGSTYFQLGEHEQARTTQLQALAIWEKAFGPKHPNVAGSLINLGDLEFSAGQYEQAKTQYQRALVIWENTIGPKHPEVAWALNGSGKTLAALEQYSAAREHLERAVAIRSTDTVGPELLAESKFVLAGVLWDAPNGQGRDRTRAAILAEQARDGFAEAGKGQEGKLAETQVWITEHFQ